LAHIDYEERAWNSPRWAQRWWIRRRISATAALVGDAKKLLDVGCGSGLLFRNTKYGMAVGVDMDGETLKLNKSKEFVPRTYWVKGRADLLPFKAGAFDSAVSTEVIEHVQQPKMMLQEIRRVMERGGHAVITTPNYRSLWPVVELIWSRFSGVRNYGQEHVSRFSPGRLTGHLMEAGFATETQTTLNGLLPLHRSLTLPVELLNRPLDRAGLGMLLVSKARAV
jgi:ubiquinone/menaquinone biosynthesis C-methylase UbiE